MLLGLEEQFRLQIAHELAASDLSAAQASRRMGNARNFLGRKLRGETPLCLRDLDGLCEVLGLNRRDLLSKVSQRLMPGARIRDIQPDAVLDLRPSYYSLMLQAVAPGDLEPSDSGVLERLAALRVSILPRDFSISPPKEYLGLIDQINQHPLVGYHLAQRQVLSLSQPPTSPREALELACMITGWAIAAMRVGRITFGTMLASVALDMHGPANLSLTYPPLLRTAATLLLDLGELPLALAVAQHAQYLSLLIESKEGHVKSALAVSGIYSLVGDVERGIQVVSKLREVPDHLAFGVQFTLAKLYFDLGDYTAANREIEIARPTNRHEELHSMWFRARLSEAESNTEVALDLFDRLLTASVGQLPPTDRLLVFLDMVPILRRTGDADVNRLLATQLLPDLEKLEVNKAASRLRDDVLDAATRGVLNPGIEAIHRKLLVQPS